MENAQKSANLKDYWQILLLRKWFLIMPLLIVPLAAILGSFFVTPTYQSTTTVLIKEANILPPSVQRDLDQGQRNERTRAEDIQIFSNQIRSSKYIKSLINRLNIPVPAKIKEEAARQLNDFQDMPIGEITENLMVSMIRDWIDVQAAGSKLISISVKSSSPIEARNMTRALAEIFLEESLTQELAGLEESRFFAEKQQAIYKEKLSAAEDELKNFRQEMIATSLEEDSTSLNRKLNSISSAVEALDIELAETEQERADLRYLLYSGNVDLSAISLPDTVEVLKGDLTASADRLTDLLSRYEWRDARVITLNTDIRNLLAAIEHEVGVFVSRNFSEYPDEVKANIERYLSLGVVIDLSRSKKAALEKSVGRIKTQLTRDPDVEIRLERLQSVVKRYRELYDLFQRHAQIAAIDQSAKRTEYESKYVIIQPAVLPLAPSSPDRRKISALGIILGLVIGVGTILLIELLDDSFKKVEDVESSLGLPVLAAVPRISYLSPSRGKNRGFAIAGTVIILILAGAIVYMRFLTN